ncbi:exonuclease SbcCD subunit D [Vibrio sonorensis]|uniref:exonuclease SbcCD subunit D n=1 Tax=Vibrio sonorensis TaxID=1004316 RepID=UPI0008DA0963|nr:exonuclease SbcCD subunit D [Vibrio sonorensis]
MKFLHTSDWHLGRHFHNISLLDDQKAVLEQISAYIESNPVDALVIAGDIYDRTVPPSAAVDVMSDFVEKVCGELNTPIVLIPGNHDGAARLGFAAQQLKSSGLHIIHELDQMTNPVLFEKDGQTLAFYGLPYTDPERVRHQFQVPVKDHNQAYEFLTQEIASKLKSGHVNVLISHCFVDGASGSDSERPLAIGGSERVDHQHFAPFDYVALGHLHQPQFKGKQTIRYSGSIMKYSFSEQFHNKGMTLVNVDDDGEVHTEQISLTAPHDMRVVEGCMADILQSGQIDPNSHDYIQVRLMDTHAILDPMEKLRSVYPNVLHLEKPGMLVNLDQPLAKARLARGELEMFADFFLEVQQHPLSDDQQDAMKQLLRQMQKGEENDK